MRENQIGHMIDLMRSRAKRRRDSSILAPFATLTAYHGQSAAKGARTRRQAVARRKEQAKVRR